MGRKHLLEAASLVSESASEDGTWKVRLISEGRGSSGIYTRELLENHHHAFDDVLSFKNHPGMWDGPQSRDFTMIAGEVVGGTWIESDERGLTAVYGNWLPDPEYRDKLERYKSKLGLSIYIEGSGYENEDGDFVVDWFNPEDPYASLDVVVAPGARGKFMESMRQVYSARAENKPSTTEVQENRNKKMEEKLDKAIELLTTLVANEAEKAAEAAQVEADAEAAREAAEKAVSAYAEAVKAVDEAELFESQREAILARASEGADVADLVAEAKKVKEEALAHVQESAPEGTVVMGETASSFGFGKVVGA